MEVMRRARSRRPARSAARAAVGSGTMMSRRPSLAILGIRGVPASHGGFETFAQRLAPYLVQRGWQVTVFCQTEGIRTPYSDFWEGVRRIHIPSADGGALSSIVFDWKSISDVLGGNFDLVLTLGYNTAAFCARLKLQGLVNIMNMDGIEWARSKWSWPTRMWFYVNYRLGCHVADHLIADHPEIGRLLRRRVRADKVTVIGYGADQVSPSSTPHAALAEFGLQPNGYATLIARPEPENSVLEIIQAFSARKRGIKLLVLGRYVPEAKPLHDKIMAAASDEVIFGGAIYDPSTVQSLRAHCLFYVHGHRVGGTNPSLVEALGAGNAVLAHDNKFNRLVAQDAALYFSNATDCAERFDMILENPEMLVPLRTAARRRHAAEFLWEEILSKYETLLRSHLPADLHLGYSETVTGESTELSGEIP